MKQKRAKPNSDPKHSPGISLVHRLFGPTDWIARVHWSPAGDAISAASQGKMSVWDTQTGRLRFEHVSSAYHVYNAAWSPDGTVIATSTSEGLVEFYDARDGHILRVFEVGRPELVAKILPGRDPGSIHGFSWSPDASVFATGNEAGVLIFDAGSGQLVRRLEGSSQAITVLYSPDGTYIASTAYGEGNVCVWESHSGVLVNRFPAPYGPALAWSPDSMQLAASGGRVVNIWDVRRGVLSNVLEGHTNRISSVAFSGDGELLASRDDTSRPGGVRRETIIWRTDTWEAVGNIVGASSWYLHTPLAFSPAGHKLAGDGQKGTVVYIWDLSALVRGKARFGPRTEFYKNAKIALLGDSGVGKSALGLVLSGNPFAPTESTHGRQVWVLERNKVETGAGRKEFRELVLWDLAGQPGYRLVHQLHLEDVSLALILIDARNELDPFSGVRHWHRALKQAKQRSGTLPNEILVAARVDRGPVGVSRARIISLLAEIGAGAYIQTSAKDGTGIDELRTLVRNTVDWTGVPTVSSNSLFQRIRRFLLKIKNAGGALVTHDDLFRGFLRSSRLRKRHNANLQDDFSTCVGRLQALGLVHRFTFGNLLLLQPEMLDAYASSIIFAAKDEPDGMGAIAEEVVKLGKIRIPDEHRLPDPDKERLLLLATIEDLIKHESAIREPANDGTLLIFPSQLTRENPDLPDPAGKSAIIAFEGAVLNIYATLVVRLSHSGLFRKTEMWKNAVLFDTATGGKCGLFLVEIDEGRGSITTFFSAETTLETRLQFEDFVHNHILQRAVPQTVGKSRVIICPEVTCSTPVSDLVLQRRRDRGFDWIECNVCGTRIPLAEPEVTTVVRDTTVLIEFAAARVRQLQTGLISATGEMHAHGFSEWAGASLTTLALVFTDVVASTKLNVELGDERMVDVRRAHFAQGNALVVRHRGYLIKTIGDSLMAAFRTASEALDFALALNRNPGHPQIQIRAGIHVGAVDIEGEDAYGNMVNYCARVISCPEGPDIWVSDHAYVDINQRKAKAHRDLKWHEHKVELKGFPGEQRLWSLLLDVV